MTKRRASERVGQLARRQQGRVSYAQLARLGLAPSTIHGWVTRGQLMRVLPGVYAVGHTAPSREADLWAAVLYAGPEAMLSHRTAAHWRGLIDHAPREIEVSTPRKVGSVMGVRVYGRRQGLRRSLHDGVPVTTVATMMVDLAAGGELPVLNRALAQLDFRRALDVGSLLAACGRGYPGSTLLREALATHQPKLRYANGPLEEAFLELCERLALPLPRLNAQVHGIRVDAYWPQAGLVVELDGEGNHSSTAQRRRDRRNDLKLRTHGLTVQRYDWVLVHEHPDDVHADVVAALERGLARAREDG